MAKSVEELKDQARINRERIVRMVHAAGVGHVGGSLSIIDILTAIFENELDFSAEKRDRLVLSKGHVTPALYACLTEKGIISEDEYPSFRQINSRLQGHPCRRDIPQIDASTGLLGQGLSVAVGMALSKRALGDPHRVYVCVGDGEIQEGQIWEAFMSSAHYKLDNLCCFVDYNKLSSSGPVNDCMNLESLVDKLKAFGQHVIEIDGHKMEEILDALDQAKQTKGQPTTVIAHTVKGKGVSFMENNPAWHSKGLSDEELETALSDLARAQKEL